MTTSGNLHVDVAVKLLDERETVWYDERIPFSPMIKHPVGVDGGFFLDGFGVAEMAHSRTVLPLFAVLEGVLGRGGDVADDVRVMKGMDHESANSLSFVGSLRNMGRDDLINIFW